MAVTYDDTLTPYDYGLTTFDGDAGAGSVTGAISETATMSGTVETTSTMTATITY